MSDDLYRYLMPGAPIAGRLRIPVGMPVFQDFSFMRWPDIAKVPVDPDIEFEATVCGDTITLRAPGYGQKDAYGCGAILINVSDWYLAHQPADYRDGAAGRGK